MQKVHVVGLGMGPEDLTKRHLELIGSAEVLVGGSRHLACFPGHPGLKIPITPPLESLFERIRELAVAKRVVILASGDPNFFGIGPRAVEALGAENASIHPNVTALQAACARLKVPWHALHWVSLHGRSWDHLDEGLAKGLPFAVYTDPDHMPHDIADYLAGHGLHDLRLCVLEDLGTAGEKVTWISPGTAGRTGFSPLNLVIVFPAEPGPRTGHGSPAAAPSLHLGMPESAFLHQRGLITKAEVRVQALARLALGPGMTLWDIGAGSGALGIEASLLVPGGRIFLVEKDRERARQALENTRRFKVSNVEVVRGAAPGCLARLPGPDRVFIGGGGKDLKDIVKESARYMKKGGRIVINAVLLSSLADAVSALEEAGLEAEILQLQVARGKGLSSGTYLKALNPVWVVSGS